MCERDCAHLWLNFISHAQRLQYDVALRGLRQVVVRRLLSVAAPNFSTLSMEQVLDLREDSLWRDFRNHVSDVLSSISVFFEALKAKHTTGKRLSVDLGLGVTSLIPLYGLLATVASMTKSIDQYQKDRSGWFAFLLKLQGGE